jgi:PAS domain S-box-containing protein
MIDEDKTKEQLINELAQMRQRIAELEALETEHKRAEEALRQSEKKYRDLVENITNVIYAIDADGMITYISPAIELFIGYGPSEIMDRSFSEFIFQEDLPRMRENFQRILSGHIEANEYRVLTKSGEIRWMHTSSQPIYVGDRIIGVQGILTDITERQALEEMWRRYEFIINTSREFMTLIDKNYAYEAVNKSYCKAHNKTQEEIIGRTVADIWGEARFTTAIKAHLDHCFTGNEVREQAWFEFAALGLRCFDVAYYPYYSSIEGIVTHAVVVSRDVTEHKRAEEAIRRLSQFRKSVIDNANVWLDVLDEKANILVWNKAAEEISGYSRHEVVGHGKIWEWLYPDEEYRNEITAKAAAIIARGEIVEDFETTIQRKDGQIRIISWNSRNLLDEKEATIGSIAIGRDITERKRAEEEREKPAEVEVSDLITMCASCKKIRDDDEDHWHPIEAYLLKHYGVRISHGICPECAKELYPNFFKDSE